MTTSMLTGTRLLAPQESTWQPPAAGPYGPNLPWPPPRAGFWASTLGSAGRETGDWSRYQGPLPLPIGKPAGIWW